MTQTKSVIGTAALLGIISGLVSTFPVALGPTASFIVWGSSGICVGLFLERKKDIVWGGIIYGVVLTFSFLLSRFGGTADKIPAYLLLAAGASIGGAAGGVIATFLGFRLRKFFL